MISEGVEYPLKPFRKWLLDNHSDLCSGHFIKAIAVGTSVRFTYDWQHIYFIASEYSFTKNYIDELQRANREFKETNPVSVESPKQDKGQI